MGVLDFRILSLFVKKTVYCPQAGRFIHSFAILIHSFFSYEKDLSKQDPPNMGNISDS